MKHKEEIARYEKRIGELRAEFEAVNKTLSDVKAERDRLPPEIAALLNNKDRLTREIALLGKDLGEAQTLLTETDARISKAASRETERMDALAAEIRSLEKQSADADAALAKKKEAIAKVKDVTADLARVEKEIGATRNDLAALNAEIEERKGSLAEREKALAQKEADVDAKITRNGRILTQTETNLRTLEHYVKRLQRHYDRSGIRIDLLKQFDIVRDNQGAPADAPPAPLPAKNARARSPKKR